MSTLKPLILYSHKNGVNPWKVAIVLEELGVPYKKHFLEFPEMKLPAYTAINPNGRVPAVEDANTGVTVFEVSCVIPFQGSHTR